MPIKAGLPEKKTGAIIGLLRVSKLTPGLNMTSNVKLMLRNMQNMIASMLLVYKERSRYQLSEVVIKEFVSKSTRYMIQ